MGGYPVTSGDVRHYQMMSRDSLPIVRGYPMVPGSFNGSQPMDDREYSKQDIGRPPSSKGFLNVTSIVGLLAVTDGHILDSRDIITRLNTTSSALKSVTEKFKTFFTVTFPKSGILIELKPQIKLCHNYINDSGCLSDSHCKKLHICHDYAYASCPNFDCEFGHKWKTTHNHAVWQFYHLQAQEEPVLVSIMKKFKRQNSIIAVCDDYNNASCRDRYNCPKLHICSNLFSESTKCTSQNCSMNHDIFNVQCTDVLRNSGIDTNDSKRDLMVKVTKAMQNQKGSNVRHEDIKGKVIEGFSNLQAQATAIKSIVSMLLVIPNFWCNLDGLSQATKIEIDVVLRLVKHYYFLFVIYQSPDDKYIVKLQPRMATCHFYNASSKCRAGAACQYIHLCAKYIRGTCNDSENCQAIHSLSDQPNSNILKKAFLHEVSPSLVMTYFKERFRASSVPFICFPYNDGNCTKPDCESMHVCYNYLFTLELCSKDCKMNHDILSASNLHLLKKNNLDDLLPAELRALLSLRISHWPKTQTHLMSTNLKGNVGTAEICLDYLSGDCKTTCSKLHARCAYHWQFCINDTWYNFCISHSKSLEELFRDAKVDSVKLSPKKYGETQTDIKALSTISGKEISVNYDVMHCTPGNHRVRRLSTPSRAACRSDFATVFGWYFKDKHGVWIEYGNTDSSGVESHYTSENSRDIENNFLKHPKGKMNVSSSRFSYTLDFSSMTQVNTKTNAVRPLRLRPKHAVIEEKMKNVDPHNLKGEGLATASMRSAPDDQIAKISSLSVSTFTTYPDFWDPMQGNDAERFKLNLSSLESVAIIAEVLKTMPNVEVIRIERLQNTFHYDSYMNHVRMLKKLKSQSNIITHRLYHGTRVKHLDSISQQNLVWRQNFADSGKKFGRGAYFSNK